jgi:hypothetical protein
MAEERIEPFWAYIQDGAPGGDTVLDGPTVELPQGLPITFVTEASQLQSLLDAAACGQIIELADGRYESSRAFEICDKAGTAEKPLVLRARNRGKAVIVGKSWLRIVESSYVVVEGLRFETMTSGNGPRRAVELLNSDHCRVTRNELNLSQSHRFADNGMVHWVYVKGEKANRNRIDHNRFTGKKQSGYFIGIEGEHAAGSPGTGVVPVHTRIDRNHFRDVERAHANGAETIKIGSGSRTVLTFAHTVVEYNLFEKCSGEDEIISVKSSGNTIRYNTFLESEGAVVLRYGNACDIYGNFFYGNDKERTGGVRLHGTDHRIFHNHFEGLTATAVTIGWGSVEEDPSVANVYWQVKRCKLAFNTFVDNRGIVFASVCPGPGRMLGPQDVTIANNVRVGNTGIFVKEFTGEQPSGLIWIDWVKPTDAVKSEFLAPCVREPLGPQNVGPDSSL